MAAKKSNIVTVRFTDRELEYLKNSVDDFYNFNVSDAVRMCVRLSMEQDEDLVSSRKKVTL